jgi:hypothetical protein
MVISAPWCPAGPDLQGAEVDVILGFRRATFPAANDTNSETFYIRGHISLFFLHMRGIMQLIGIQ